MRRSPDLPPELYRLSKDRHPVDPRWSKIYMLGVIAIILLVVGTVVGIAIHDTWAAVGHLSSLIDGR
ncbi:MAG TPA: hypothetical protein VE442_06770 [Jatrophihabitans sp.]|jgi:hypothetical protein|nr:hypothetical protein [Jatrophihabitans sp.]